MSLAALFARLKYAQMRRGTRVIVKWNTGIGRSSVIEVKGDLLRLTPPLMRADYRAPFPESELVLKPLDGGQPFRSIFVGHGESGWTIRVS